MKILTSITIQELKDLAPNFFGDMVKAVIDIEKKHIAVDAELHADLEKLMLEEGSKQQDLWGVNFYPFESEENFLEFDSMINIRPSQNNRSRDVEDLEVRKKIEELVNNGVIR